MFKQTSASTVLPRVAPVPWDMTQQLTGVVRSQPQLTQQTHRVRDRWERTHAILLYHSAQHTDSTGRSKTTETWISGSQCLLIVTSLIFHSACQFLNVLACACFSLIVQLPSLSVHIYVTDIMLTSQNKNFNIIVEAIRFKFFCSCSFDILI